MKKGLNRKGQNVIGRIRKVVLPPLLKETTFTPIVVYSIDYERVKVLTLTLMINVSKLKNLVRSNLYGSCMNS